MFRDPVLRETNTEEKVIIDRGWTELDGTVNQSINRKVENASIHSSILRRACVHAWLFKIINTNTGRQYNTERDVAKAEDDDDGEAQNIEYIHVVAWLVVVVLEENAIAENVIRPYTSTVLN